MGARGYIQGKSYPKSGNFGRGLGKKEK